MQIDEMHSWFNILLDHYNEPYFIDTEIDEFINSGTMEFVNDIIFKEYFPTLGENEKGIQALNSMESVIQGSEILQPLIIEDIVVPVTSGYALKSSIDSAIQTETGDSNDKLMHVVATVYNNGTEDRLVRYVRHNDKARFNQNVFKKATERNPIFSVSRRGLKISPSTLDELIMSVLKTPRKVSKEDSIDSDMPEFTHQRIIAYAIAMSGVASRDEVLLQLQKISGNGTARQ